MNQTDQVLQLYETGADPQVIARAMDLSENMVTTILTEKSAAFRRKACPIDRTKPVADQMLDVMTDMALNSDNEFIRLRAATTVRDDLKGRRDQVQTDAAGVGAALVALGQRFAELQEQKRKFFEDRTIQVS